MIMRIPYVGISRTRRFRMVDMCKGKRKLWLRGTDDILVVGLHVVGKRVKVSSLKNVTSFLALLFFFHLIHPSHIFLATPLLSFSYFFQSLFHSFIRIYLFLFFFIFLFFFLSFPYTYFCLYFPSLDIVLPFQRSQLLSFLHAHNLNFKPKSC
jgi:hypothetical protein